MPKSRLQPFCTFIWFLMIIVVSQQEISGKSLNSVRSAGELDAITKGVCSGKVGECSLGDLDQEMILDSDSNRRVLLMQRRYISYATLLRGLVPCGRPGASYYNCKGTPAVANSYNRGCEMITRCARGY